LGANLEKFWRCAFQAHRSDGSTIPGGDLAPVGSEITQPYR
jgi:hypothetical protein